MAASKALMQSAILLILLAAGFIYIRLIERRQLFHPVHKVNSSPADIGLSFEDCYFKSPDGRKLHGWFIPAQEARSAVIFAHGNAGNIGDRLDKIKFFNQLKQNVFIFDYRGYGASQGRPSEKGMYLDARGAYEYLLSRGIRADQLIGFGESMGGAILIDLAAEKKLKALIVESTFSSSKDLVRIFFPWIPYQLFASRLDSEAKIKSIQIPKLIIHSREDELIPIRLAQKLYQAAPQPKEFLQIRGPHNDGFFESTDILEQGVSDFLNNLPK
ncbi:alpha/beta hydrolase [Candidatus Omnitrophota bacterium]